MFLISGSLEGACYASSVFLHLLAFLYLAKTKEEFMENGNILRCFTKPLYRADNAVYNQNLCLKHKQGEIR
jgi:hypothetical protein